jgi:hypothetical protein
MHVSEMILQARMGIRGPGKNDGIDQFAKFLGTAHVVLALAAIIHDLAVQSRGRRFKWRSLLRCGIAGFDGW